MIHSLKCVHVTTALLVGGLWCVPFSGFAQSAPALQAPKRIEVPGGWFLTTDGDARHVRARVAVSRNRTGFAMARTILRDDMQAVLGADLWLFGASGAPTLTGKFSGREISRVFLSPNGDLTAAAVFPFGSADKNGALHIYRRGSLQAKIAMRPEEEVLLGDTWVALGLAPISAAELGLSEEVAGLTDPPSFRFLSPAGEPLTPTSPITGSIAVCGNGLVAAKNDKLLFYDSELALTQVVSLPFDRGHVVGGGAQPLVAVMDARTGVGERAVFLFDENGTKLGALKVRASIGVEAAIAPSGASILLWPAVAGRSGPGIAVDSGAKHEVLLVGRAGSVVWRQQLPRLTEQEYIALADTTDAKTAAIYIVTPDGGRAHERLILLNPSGNQVYVAEGRVTGAWLDPGGEVLVTQEGGALSRLSVKKLVSHKAIRSTKAE